jgi:hypothetical protein
MMDYNRELMVGVAVITMVGGPASDPRFALDMWRGPAKRTMISLSKGRIT